MGRGFAGMSVEKRRAIAARGGRAAHAKGTAYEWTPAQAKAAGRKGGRAAVAAGVIDRLAAERRKQAKAKARP